MHKHVEYEFKFCPVCGGRLNNQNLKANEPSRLVCADCDYVFYLDPKLVACVIVDMNGKIVLLKRGIEPQKGRWVMPGGYVDRGEEVIAAAHRETEEECGLKIEIKDLLGVYSYPEQVEVVVVYVATPKSGNLYVGDETQDVKICGPQEIPWENLAFQSTTDAIKDFFKPRENE